MAAPKIQSCSMVVVKVKGMQKTAMVRSATARFIRKARRSVRDRCPTVSTTITTMLPATASIVVDVYRAISTYWYSSGSPGSCCSADATVDDSLNAENHGPAGAVTPPASPRASTVHAILTATARTTATVVRWWLSLNLEDRTDATRLSNVPL